MKKINLILGITLCFLILSGGSVFAVDYYNEDFETFNVGNLSGQQNWSGGGGLITDANQQAGSNRSFLTDANIRWGYGATPPNFSVPITGYFAFDFFGNVNRVRDIYLYDRTDNVFIGVLRISCETINCILKNGSNIINGYYGVAPINQWNKLYVFLDNNNNIFSVSFDNVNYSDIQNYSNNVAVGSQMFDIYQNIGTDTDGFYIDNIILTDSFVTTGVCGADNGQITNAEPPTGSNTLCLSGTASQIAFNGLQWTWDCLGSGGGSDDSCISYNTLPVNAVCGADNGQTVTEITDTCDVGDLIFPTFVTTFSGWTWTCGGINGGSNADCSASSSGFIAPDLPDQDDCSLQSIPDRWFCEISNALKSIFLPSSKKINDLQITINKINGRFPFNYLSAGKTTLESLENNTNSDSLELTILGNTGEINIDAVSPLMEGLQFFTSGLFMLGFVFWALGYIKHFFK